MTRYIKTILILYSLALALAWVTPCLAENSLAVSMGNGIKIGEVTTSSAIVWTRLTQHPERNLNGLHWGANELLPEGTLLAQMEDSVLGATGEVKVSWSLRGELAGESKWLRVDPNRDFTRHVQLSGLLPGERYVLNVYSRTLDGKEGQSVSGAFRTAPIESENAPVFFTVVTGQEFSRRDNPENGHTIYESMLDLNPDFFVHTGDIVYYDFARSNPKAKNEMLARYKWNRSYAMPFQRSFHRSVSSYFIKDDHDTVKNDCWAGQHYGALTWELGLEIFREQVPMSENTYRTVRWGKDVQVWFVEGRDFRSPNTMPDGPNKTIWGEEQKKWFFDTVKESDATFRILISPTPIVGPDRGNKNDNHANVGFTHEGDEIRRFIGQQKNMLVVCGDRHWQYVSKDPQTGVKEYSCGPTSDFHAGGFSEDNRSSMHQYLKVKGGFLSVRVERLDGVAQAVMTHHSVEGKVYNKEILRAK